MVITMITMAIGQKTGSGEGFCHGDYHGNGQNTVLKVEVFALVITLAVAATGKLELRWRR